MGPPLADALALPAALDVGVGLAVGGVGETDGGMEGVENTTGGEAVVVAGPPEREINTPVITAAATSTPPAMIKITDTAVIPVPSATTSRGAAEWRMPQAAQRPVSRRDQRESVKS